MKDGFQNQCKSCMKEHESRWRLENPEKCKEAKRRQLKNRRKKDYDGESNKRRNWLLKHKYGLTSSDYDKMVELQNGKCSICDKSEKIFSNGKHLVVDHCHKTGRIRSLLCGACNSLIGLAKENINILGSAIKYLEVHS